MELTIIYFSLLVCSAIADNMEDATTTYEERLELQESLGNVLPGSFNVSLPRAIICQGNIKESVHVQMLFAFDITTSTNPAKYIAKDFVSQIDAVTEDVSSISPGAEYALTYHANWPGSAFFEEIPHGHSMEEACYIRKTKFVKDISQIKSIAESTTAGINGPASTGAEATLPAAAFAAVDKVVGWESSKMDGSGKQVHRFIVMYTDDDSVFVLDQPGDRTDFRLDGTDSCATTWPPTYEIYNKIFTEQDVKIIGIFNHQALETVYMNHFKEIGTPFCSIFYGGAESFRRIKYCIETLIQCSD